MEQFLCCGICLITQNWAGQSGLGLDWLKIFVIDRPQTNYLHLLYMAACFYIYACKLT